MDFSFVGRGNGKSAFALNLIEEINQEFCLDISNEQNKCFGLHIIPEASGRTKTFYSFVDLIFEAIIEKGIIPYSLASLRLEAISQLYPDLKLNFASEADSIEKMNDINWFRENNVEIAAITKHFYQNDYLNKIETGFPLNRDRNTFFSTFITTVKDFKKYYYESLKKGNERLRFLFNDLVLFFEASGFNGAYLIVDDFERIPDFQSEKLKQEFALEIRTNFFDGVLENAKKGFYNLILVLHAGVPRLLDKAWAVSGMNRRSPMNDDAAKHTIRFDKLTSNHALLMVEKYLDEYRLNDKVQSKLHPFTADAIKMIGEKAELNASTILEKSHYIIEEAAREGVETITKEYVSSKIGKAEEETPRSSEDVSKEPSQDLFKKAKKK